MDADGKSIGQVSIKKEDDGLLVKTTVTGLKPGNYAFHLHTVGKFEAPGFTSAEGHWNPTGKEHGKDNPQGKHMGDLPNIEVTASGSGSLEQKISAATPTKGENALIDAVGDRKSVVQGKIVSVSVDLACRSIIKKKKTMT